MSSEQQRPTGNSVPLGSISDAILKVFLRVQLLTRVSFVHERILLHIILTQITTEQFLKLYSCL